MAELLHNPPILSKARQELSNKIPPRELIQEQEIPHLPYIDAVIKETMRLHPATPLLLPHYTEQEAEIHGYIIPKHTQVFVNVWSILRDPAYWDDPTRFKPDRFLNSGIDVRGNDCKFIPFGAGRRICPGSDLAMRMASLIVSNLVHGFDWELPGGLKAEDMDMTDGVGMAPQKHEPLVIVPPNHLILHVKGTMVVVTMMEEDPLFLADSSFKYALARYSCSWRQTSLASHNGFIHCWHHHHRHHRAVCNGGSPSQSAHPHKVEQELSNKIPAGELIQEQDILHFPYKGNDETASLIAAPLAPLHRSRSSNTWLHHPKHTQVFVNVWSILTDPAYLDYPTRFKPDRFMNLGIDVWGNDCKKILLGAGRHICLGSNIAMRMAGLMVFLCMVLTRSCLVD
ncbi:UNVERIFIED_CONTAM: cytochrome [Sesamum calycinum]|uniref:Cytochrome n=1 Tax=Sesamum calycinum TaxID=2727403 RepID=A0AAW2QZ66_9LAMI